MTKNVVIIGAHGKMGTATVSAIEQSADFSCVKKLSRNDNLAETLSANDVDIAIDFTNANAVYDNAKVIIEHNVRPIIGSSGLSSEQIDELSTLCSERQLGGIIAPNFSIGAIMMMKCAAMAAEHFPNVEIIEAHHQQKIDAPSGTAIKTAAMIANSRKQAPTPFNSSESLEGARGSLVYETAIHSLRLPGVIAKQDVVFGGQGETLTISHNSLNRESFMPGVLLACRRSLELKQLVYGLENLI